MLINSGKDIFAQNEAQDTSYSDDGNSDDIISIYGESKFRFISSLQTGINIPLNNFGKNFGAGIGFQISVYSPFNRTIGAGMEFQLNHFSGKEFHSNIYSVEELINNGGFNTYFLKFNFLIGNLNPKNKFVYYGLFGVGGEYYSGHLNSETSTYYDPFSNQYFTYSYQYNTNSYFSFIYGAGLGAFYKISGMFGVNCEIQYNKLPNQDNFYHLDGGNEYAGFLSVKVGIMYTKF